MQKNVLTKRRKLFLSIVLSALALFGVFGLVACRDEVTVDDIKNLGFPITVEYDYQGGTANNKQSVTILVAKNSKLPAPRNGQGAIGVPAKSGYSFKCFTLAVLDEDGKPVLDEDNKMIPSETVWNFDTDRVADKDVYLCATYWDNYKVTLHYGVDANYDQTKVFEISREESGKPNKLFESNLRIPDYTFLSYELDGAEGRTVIGAFPYTLKSDDFEKSDDKLTVHVYGNALKGTYSLIRTANDLMGAPVGEDVNYYLLADIDLGGAEYDDQTAYTKLPKVYSGKFVGNDHTISNFTLNLSTLDNSYRDFGLFRSLGDEAEITDVTFENVVINTDLSNKDVTTYNLGMLAGQVSGGAKVNNVTITTAEESEDNVCALSYKLGIGMDPKVVNVASDMTVAVKAESATVNCTVDKVDMIVSDVAYSSDKNIAIYFTYRIHDGVVILADTTPFDAPIYGLATKNNAGNYSRKSIRSVEKQGENHFILEQTTNARLDITFSIDGTAIMATIVQL